MWVFNFWIKVEDYKSSKLICDFDIVFADNLREVCDTF